MCMMRLDGHVRGTCNTLTLCRVYYVYPSTTHPSGRFNAATGLVPVKTKVGGMATLQKAIVLDSLGFSEDAKKLYKSLRGHGVACECAPH